MAKGITKFTEQEALNISVGSSKWKAYTAGTSAGAVATKAAGTNEIQVITWATFFSDTDSLVTIKDGSDTIWEGHMDVGVAGTLLHVTFPFGTLFASSGAAVTANIASSTTDCGVSFGGFSISN